MGRLEKFQFSENLNFDLLGWGIDYQEKDTQESKYNDRGYKICRVVDVYLVFQVPVDCFYKFFSAIRT